MIKKTQFYFFVLLLGFFVVSVPVSFGKKTTPNLSATAKSAPECVLVPVLYLTDRNKEGKSFGPQRKYTVHCLHDMYYGVTYVPVLNEKFKTPGEEFERLGWQPAPKTKAKIYEKVEIKAATPELEKQLFFDRLAESLDKSKDNRLCIFMHGGADPFEDSTLDAAELSYFMDCPVVIYAWPSVGKLNRYRVDEGNVEWSQEHFNTFLSDLQSFQERRSCQITMVAHSMGNRLMARAVGRMREGGLVHDIALVSPDIDAETFEHYVMGYRSQNTKVRLYVSNRDKVLPFTQMLYGGYYRLGEGVGAVLSMVSPLQKPANHSSHSTILPQTKIMAPRLEKIDFTDVDQGIIGHNLPFDLVANMSRHNEPGKGLALVPGVEGEGNKFARYERWRNKLGPVDESRPGYCKRVVPVARLQYEKEKAGELSSSSAKVE